MPLSIWFARPLRNHTIVYAGGILPLRTGLANQMESGMVQSVESGMAQNVKYGGRR
jgi:hypothetical protein